MWELLYGNGNGVLVCIFISTETYYFFLQVHIHGSNLEKFHQALDPCTLPPDFGGNGPELSPIEMITLLEKNGEL